MSEDILLFLCQREPGSFQDLSRVVERREAVE